MKPESLFGDRIQLPLHFDASEMERELGALDLHSFVYYDVLPLRSPAHLVDSNLPMPPPADDYADGSWTPWLDTPALTDSPYLSSVVDTFKENCDVTLVRILRLAAGSRVDRHTDPTLGLEIERSVIRLTIPIALNDGVEFRLNDTVVPMKPGECWYLRLSDPHEVTNAGSTERINMTIDMVPNDWLKSMLA